MTIKTQLLRDFLKRTAGIKPALSIPLTDHILFKPGMIQRTNLEVSATLKAPSITDTILVEEKSLSAVVNQTTAEEITINKDGKKIIISDGMPMSHGVTQAELFPVITAMAGSEITLSQEIKDALAIASRFVSDNPNTGSWNYVHMKDNYIAGTDGSKMYYETFDHTHFNLPNIVMDINDVNILNGLDECIMSDDDNHYFIRSEDYEFCFTKTEEKTPDFATLIKHRQNTEGISFTINRNQWISYCERANSIVSDKITLSSISSVGFDLISTEKSLHMDCQIPDIIFKFNARTILPAIKALSSEIFDCSLAGQALIIKENNSIILFQGVQ